MISLNAVTTAIKQSYEQGGLQVNNKIHKTLFLVSPAEQNVASVLKKWCIANKVLAKFSFVNDLATPDINRLLAKSGELPYTFCVLTNPTIFKRIANGTLIKDGNMRTWRGSVIPQSTSGLRVPLLITLPLLDSKRRPAIHTDPQFEWILHSDLSKILRYQGQYEYRYTILPSAGSDNVEAYDVALAYAKRAAITVGDIETNLGNIVTSNAFTHILPSGNIGHTFVTDLTSVWKTGITHPYKYTRAVYADTSAVKCFHNGCFDTAHLLRHRIPVHNWLYDTEYMWHSWEAEPLKSLAFVASIALPDYIYWKAENKTNPLEYNAKDTINTARVLLWLFKHMPEWAWHNYGQLLPVLIPTVICNLEGFATDPQRMEYARQAQLTKAETAKEELRTMLAQPDLSPNSPKQLETILYEHLGQAFGWTRPLTMGNRKRARATGSLPSCTDGTTLRSLAIAHPVAARIVEALGRFREASKAYSTYFNSHLYGDTLRLYYSFNPDGTKTGRFSCTASSLRLVTGCSPKDGSIRKSDIKNYGNQIQNSPSYYKKALMADAGYVLFNIDKSKSEAYCVALISGDAKFQAALDDKSLDFYLRLAEWFFGIVTNNNKELPIRKVTKKVNHATSYCMGWETFLDQVGLVQLYAFMDMVGWTGPREPRIFINYLLESCYHGTFPGIKLYWTHTTQELIRTNGYLQTPDGAVRHFFSVPKSPRGISPSAVAHQPQRLSVVGLNRAMAQVFYEIQLPTAFALRLKGQVHDSLVGQVKKGSEHLIQEAHAIMERPYETSKGTLRIPCDIEGPSTYWKEEY